MDKIIIYTDGSARGNPGPGGFGAILIWGEKVKEIAEAYRHTTNNRMELLAVIKAISILKTKKLPILVYTDSKYVVESVEKKWLDNWIKTDFKGGKKNKDLWLAFYELSKVYKVKFHWVKAMQTTPITIDVTNLPLWQQILVLGKWMPFMKRLTLKKVSF